MKNGRKEDMSMSESQHIGRDGITREPERRGRKRLRWRRLGGTVAVLSSSAAVLLGAAAAAQAEPLPTSTVGTVFAYPSLNVHPGDLLDGPDLSRIIDQIPYNTPVVITCQVSGPAETEFDGTTTTLWDRVAGYQGNDPAAWVSDAWVNTGSNDRVVNNNGC
jgi:hypothetical protein